MGETRDAKRTVIEVDQIRNHQAYVSVDGTSAGMPG